MIYTVTPNCVEPECPYCGLGLYQHPLENVNGPIHCLTRWWGDQYENPHEEHSRLLILQKTYDPFISMDFSLNDVSKAEFRFGDSNFTLIELDDYHNKAKGISRQKETPETVYMKILILFNAIKGQPNMFWARDYPRAIKSTPPKGFRVDDIEEPESL